MRVAVAIIAVAGALVGLTAPGCSSKAESRGGGAVAVSGMSAVPANARVVVAFDVDRLAGSQVVARAAAQLVAHAPDLGARIERLSKDCGIDVTTQVRRVILALGDPDQGQVLLVATGSVTEAALAQCLTRVVGGGGGSVNGRMVNGRTLYTIKEGTRTVHFTFGQADTVVIGTLEPWVLEAVGPGKKVGDTAEMKELLARVDAKAPVWAAGLVDSRVAAGLVRASKGQIARGPQAVFGTLDPVDGLRAELGAVMPSEDDAKAMESLVKPQMGLLAVAAQVKGLGPVVGKLTARREGTVVRLGLALTEAELNQVLKAIDMGAPASQDAPPAASATVPESDAGSSGD
jgi:hypothetical protein